MSAAIIRNHHEREWRYSTELTHNQGSETLQIKRCVSYIFQLYNCRQFSIFFDKAVCFCSRKLGDVIVGRAHHSSTSSASCKLQRSFELLRSHNLRCSMEKTAEQSRYQLRVFQLKTKTFHVLPKLNVFCPKQLFNTWNYC